MSFDAHFLEHLHDLLAGIGPIRTRRMFGAAGLYAHDLFIAVVEDDNLYLKADVETEAAFQAAGSRPFTFESGGETKTTHFWRLPDAALDDPDEAVRWARLALDAAARAAAKKGGKGRAPKASAP